MSDVLHSTADNDIDYFFIDLSMLFVQDNCFPNFLFNMVSALGLMGNDHNGCHSNLCQGICKNF